MTEIRLWYGGFVWLALLTSPSGAQQPRAPMAPTEVLTRFVEPQGARGRPLGEIVFRGCPQDDLRGQEILEAFAGATLTPEALSQIGFTWRNTLAQCEYAPLGDWYDNALRQLVASGDVFNLQFFINAIGQNATETMRETIWAALEQRTEWTNATWRPSDFEIGTIWDLLADIAVADARPHEWVARVVDALARRPVPERWSDWKTQEMVREHPTIFMRTLVRAVPTFPDDRLLFVLRVLQRNIRGGGLGRQAPDLNALRWAVRGRAGISSDSLIGPVN